MGASLARLLLLLIMEQSTDGQWVVDDWDQRRCAAVNVGSINQINEDFVLKAVEKFIDTLPTGVVEVTISAAGSLVLTNPPAEPIEDTHSWAPLYPARTEFPEQVATTRREELTECGRLGKQVDLVTYSPQPGETKTVVFKYNMTGTGVAIMWHEANCVLRMPPHPNIVLFDALVVDSVDNVDSVVGFTTRYIPGGTLSENKDRVFKLKYLEQLISAVDHLNLRLGIVHGDVCPWNLAIDPEMDSIQLFDFNRAAKLGWEGDKENCLAFRYDEARNDMKFVMLTVQEFITREFCSRLDSQPHELDVPQFLVTKDWVPHQDAKLDSPVEKYRRVLNEWIQRRADVGIDHFSNASEPLDWPPLVVDQIMKFHPPKLGMLRALMAIYGRKYLTWERPPTTSLPLPKGQRLLATGEVVPDGIGQGSGASGSGSGK